MTANSILILVIAVGALGFIGYALWASRQNKSKVFKNDATFTRDARLKTQEKQQDKDYSATPFSRSKTDNFSANIPAYATSPVFNDDPVAANVPESAANLDFEEQPIEVSPHITDEKPMTRFEHIQVELPKRQRPSLDSTPKNIAPVDKNPPLYPDFFEPLSAEPSKIEPTVDLIEPELTVPILSTPPTESEVTPAPETASSRDVLELWLVAQPGQAFAGDVLSTAFAKQRFILGARNVYCRYRENSSAMPVVFRVANGDVASGEFDVQNFAESSVQSIVLFMFLSDDHHQDEANLHLMLRSAESLAQSLNAELLTGDQKPFDKDQEAAYFAQVSPAQIKG